VLTVSELTRTIKLLLEESLPQVWLKGEVSNCRRAVSGHLYFTLKDERAVIRAVLFRGYREGIRFQVEDGLTLVVHGSVSLFEKRGEYQIIVDFAEPEGRGALQLAFEQLKERLKEEGLFDRERKRPIPPFPDAVGVVTSESGAAVRDILNVISRRHSGLRVVLYPTLVQGAGAAEQIAEAIRTANRRAEVDVLIVGRGGGSLEDLWPFNEEVVARAIYESGIPVISAVGHEIDFTISDFVADLRAPTPSAAAELVVQNKEELLKRHRDLTGRLLSGIRRILSQRAELLDRYTVDTLAVRMTSLMREKTMALDEAHKMLHLGMDLALREQRGRLQELAGRLNVLSPLGTLARGYSVTSRESDGATVSSVRAVKAGEAIRSRVADGVIRSTVRDAIPRDMPGQGG
jgi:exodeoxyribonuclease VII large subunit